MENNNQSSNNQLKVAMIFQNENKAILKISVKKAKLKYVKHSNKENALTLVLEI